MRSNRIGSTINFNHLNNMKELKIQIPDNKEIDWEESAKQKKVVLRNVRLTYEDVCKELFKNGYCYVDTYGRTASDGRNEKLVDNPNNAITTSQLKCILAKNKLTNVAVYLNDGWRPDLKSDGGYCIVFDHYEDLVVDHCAVLCAYSLGKVMFKSKELAQQAIEILGETEVRLALKPLY